MVLAAGIAEAQKGQGGSKGPKVKTTQPSPKVGGGNAKLSASAAQGPKVKSTTTTTKVHGPKTTTTKTHGKPAAKTITAGSTKAKTNTKGPDRTTATTSTSTIPKATTSGDVTLSAVQQKLQRNKNLAGNLERRLPAGTDLIAAAEGFRNLGQFVAAVNVSNNLGLSFTELKSRMVDDGMSLGQAIQAERNDVDATALVLRAERDAQTLIDETDAATTPTTRTRKPAQNKRGGGR
jgi:hypothetical protein